MSRLSRFAGCLLPNPFTAAAGAGLAGLPSPGESGLGVRAARWLGCEGRLGQLAQIA
jgi:hypothetical protein